MSIQDVEQFQEYKISYNYENFDQGTEYRNFKGLGNGQIEYAEVKRRFPNAEIRLTTRTVVRINSSWEPSKPDSSCTGSGYAHSPHGDCLGYATDRT